MKVDMRAMKEQMTIMMEAMMSMRKMMEVNVSIAVAASTITKRDSIHPPGFNQVSRSILDVVGQEGEGVDMSLIISRSKVSLLFHHMVCLLIIHYLLLYTLLVRISIIPHPYSLRINNPNQIILMHMSLNLWGKHMKLLKTTL